MISGSYPPAQFAAYQFMITKIQSSETMITHTTLTVSTITPSSSIPTRPSGRVPKRERTKDSNSSLGLSCRRLLESCQASSYDWVVRRFRWQGNGLAMNGWDDGMKHVVRAVFFFGCMLGLWKRILYGDISYYHCEPDGTRFLSAWTAFRIAWSVWMT